MDNVKAQRSRDTSPPRLGDAVCQSASCRRDTDILRDAEMGKRSCVYCGRPTRWRWVRSLRMERG